MCLSPYLTRCRRCSGRWWARSVWSAAACCRFVSMPKQRAWNQIGMTPQTTCLSPYQHLGHSPAGAQESRYRETDQNSQPESLPGYEGLCNTMIYRALSRSGCLQQVLKQGAWGATAPGAFIFKSGKGLFSTAVRSDSCFPPWFGIGQGTDRNRSFQKLNLGEL